MNFKHGMQSHPLYGVWNNIKTRCYNPKTHNYSVYGAKGITLCDEWRHNFKGFYEWSITNGYQSGLTLDRKDSNIGYNPNNCRWVTPLIQQRNKSRHRNSKSIYIGVYHQTWSNKVHFLPMVRVDKKTIHLGSYSNEEEAAKIRDKYIVDNNLEGYKLNFPL